ncbi:hypothetical protein MRX96_020844 [Rhipicephalus microplus]|uniref:Uncharacterized protein n=1 Tax=Rhipicephalus microplus TaxID=6941 RepID=A0A9J6E9H1_RHIMP|nr:hypothetical protein HPB51_011592 [Rhipicephalus microplus]
MFLVQQSCGIQLREFHRVFRVITGANESPRRSSSTEDPDQCGAPSSSPSATTRLAPSPSSSPLHATSGGGGSSAAGSSCAGSSSLYEEEDDSRRGAETIPLRSLRRSRSARQPSTSSGSPAALGVRASFQPDFYFYSQTQYVALSPLANTPSTSERSVL